MFFFNILSAMLFTAFLHKPGGFFITWSLNRTIVSRIHMSHYNTIAELTISSTSLSLRERPYCQMSITEYRAGDTLWWPRAMVRRTEAVPRSRFFSLLEWGQSTEKTASFHQEWRVRTGTMLLEFQNGLCGRDWPAGHEAMLFSLYDTYETTIPSVPAVRSASQCVLTYGWEQRGYMCLLVHAAFLAKLAWALCTQTWCLGRCIPKIILKTYRCKNRRNLGPYITTCTIGRTNLAPY